MWQNNFKTFTAFLCITLEMLSARKIDLRIPNPPLVIDVNCGIQEANILWHPADVNNAPILYYTIEYNTSIMPDIWNVAGEKVPATDSSWTISMGRWANYTFRVTAVNEVGSSHPGYHTKSCSREPDVPHKNPDDIRGEGTTPTNLVISWTPMPPIEHSGPGFHYRVFWKRDAPGEKWNVRDIFEWKQDELVIENLPTFVRYRIKVVAKNQVGQSSAAVNEVIGYSGEGIPTEAPSHFQMIQYNGSSSVLLGWDAVPVDTIKGHFKRYVYQTWNEVDGEKNMEEGIITGCQEGCLLLKSFEGISHFRLAIENAHYRGPFVTLDFEDLEHGPSIVDSFDIFPESNGTKKFMRTKRLKPKGLLRVYRQTDF